MKIPDEDLEVSAIRVGCVGGQQIGSPKMDVKVLHKPTGIYAVCGIGRSQHKNRNIALAMVEYGLLEAGYSYENGILLL